MLVKTSPFPNAHSPIGLFDSGAGGLFVLNHLYRVLPTENFLYLADTLHFPYGEKKGDEIKKLALGWGLQLHQRGCKALIIACNTATAYALDSLKESLSIPVMGPIQCAAERALSLTKNGNIGVLATTATIRSGIYSTLLKEANCLQIESPLLAYLVQECQLHDGKLEEALHEYLEPLIHANVDTLILGCTHFPYVEPLIKQIHPFNIVDSSSCFIPKFLTLLKDRNTCGSSIEFEVTGDRSRFEESIPLYLHTPVLNNHIQCQNNF